MNILLIDAYSAQHIGNAALVVSSLEQLKSQFPKAQFTILAFDPISIAKLTACKTIETLWAEPFFTYSKLEQIRWVVNECLWIIVNTLNFSFLRKMRLFVDPSKYTFSPKKRAAIKAYSDADIVVSISGEALQDSLWKRIIFFLYGYWLAHKMGKIVAIFPQSIGPIKKWYIKGVTRYVLNLCDLVLPRDHLSFRTVNQLGIDAEKVQLVPDVAVNQPYISSKKARQLLEEEEVKLNRRPLVGMAISRWKELDNQKYLLVMKVLCQFITMDLKGTVVLFSPNMPFRKEISDWEVAKGLYESLPIKENVILLSKIYTPSEFKGMQGELDLFLSTRMHAAILATMIGTPTITVNTQPKLLGYMELIHQQERACKVEDFTEERAKGLIQDTIKNSLQIKRDLRKARHELEERAATASKLLRKIYKQRKEGTV